MTMGPEQRQDLALHALAGTAPISRLAAEHEVSRKFIYRQRARANEALHDAFFEEETPTDEILFHLPVTKDWLDQLILGLTLTCHSLIRGVGELCRDWLDYPISVGKVHEVLQRAVEQARQYNRQQSLAAVRIGAHDEIFHSGRPVLVGADVDFTYCYLLSLEDHRDADTWGLRLLELQDRGFQPEATIADAGTGLRAGQTLAMPEVPCRGDVFHALQTVQPLVTFLENRAYDALSLAADVAILADWLRHDILSLAGPDHGTRCELYDFVVAEPQQPAPRLLLSPPPFGTGLSGVAPVLSQPPPLLPTTPCGQRSESVVVTPE